MTDERRKNLKEVYEFLYTCDKCKLEYGSDKFEKNEHLCPICEEK